MKTKSQIVLPVLMSLSLMACGNNPEFNLNLPPVGVVEEDGAVVHGRAIMEVSSEQQSSLAKILQNLWIAKAYAATGSTTVTYTNAAAVNFTINVASLTPGAFSGTTLSLGSVGLSTLRDNNLRECGTSGHEKCHNAAIRVYTTGGSTAGFVHASDGYGVPVYTGTLNPTSAVGLNAAGSVQVQTLSIPNNKNVVNLTDFPSPTYSVSADFSNAGAGNYSMTYVVEYVLLP